MKSKMSLQKLLSYSILKKNLGRRFLPALLLTLFHFPVLSYAEYWPTERTEWSPGIPTSESIVESPVIKLSDRGIIADSSADVSGLIQTALDELKEKGGVVELPAGKFRLDDQLTFNGNQITLRGAGPEQTKLYSGYSGSSILIVEYKRGNWLSLNNAIKGNHFVVVADASPFTIGEFAELAQDNVDSLMITSPDWDVSWADQAVGQMAEITDIQGDTLFLRQMLHASLKPELNAVIRPMGLRRNVRLEDFYIKKTVATGHTIEVKNAAYILVQGIESEYTHKSHIENNTVLGAEYKNNYFHHSYSYGGGGSGYGVSLHYHTTDCLVQNNIFFHLRHSMIIQNGASGNVFAYNFSTEPVQGEDGENNLNVGWNPPDMSMHGHYAQYNLIEGNVITEMGIADFWGPMGPGNTYFRNHVVAQDGIQLMDHSHKQNILANKSILFTDDGTSLELIQHGNQWAGAAPQWDAEIEDQSFPGSYYLKAKPSFWPSDLSFPAVGPGISTEPGQDTIPAQKRYVEGNFWDIISANQVIPKSNLTSKPLLDVRIVEGFLQFKDFKEFKNSGIQIKGSRFTWLNSQGEVLGNGLLTEPSSGFYQIQIPTQGMLYLKLEGEWGVEVLPLLNRSL